MADAVVVEAPAAPKRRGRPRGSTAMAKQEAAVAVRAEKVRGKAAVKRQKEKDQQQIDRYKGQLGNLAKKVADEPMTDAALEFGGTIGEAALKVKAPKAHKYVPILALGVELYCYTKLRDAVSGGKGRKASSNEITALKSAASVARGSRARATVQVADDIVGKVFG